ncbi:unnamed protein product [Didymodactylos carnosus]|uniref:NHL repeat containing protein n=1 Tax=Didymodactylos carnosus TaxID=1234261 RepID=A0A8S2L319_9BILA|nr:unnamed protein product [Didymodactylos carnosus]CAF3883407.1 unnamed protein product [Didymodactylos carnosus]
MNPFRFNCVTHGYGGYGSGFNKLRNPNDVFVDSIGNIFISDYGNRRIQKWNVNSTGQGITTVGGDSNFDPQGIFVTQQGDIYVSESHIIDSSSRIVKYSSSLNSLTKFAAFSTTDLGMVTGIVLDQCDNVYVADYNKHQILKFNNNSYVGLTVAGITGKMGTNSSYHLNRPQDVTLDQYGNLYIADTSNRRIQRVIVQDGSGTTMMETIVETTQYVPKSIAFDSKWNLYISDSNNHRIQRYDFKGGDLYC